MGNYRFCIFTSLHIFTLTQSNIYSEYENVLTQQFVVEFFPSCREFEIHQYSYLV